MLDSVTLFRPYNDTLRQLGPDLRAFFVLVSPTSLRKRVIRQALSHGPHLRNGPVPENAAICSCAVPAN